jgi:hypothetical protein
VSILSDIHIIHITVRSGVVMHVCILQKGKKPEILEPEFHYKVDYEPEYEEEES